MQVDPMANIDDKPRVKQLDVFAETTMSNQEEECVSTKSVFKGNFAEVQPENHEHHESKVHFEQPLHIFGVPPMQTKPKDGVFGTLILLHGIMSWLSTTLVLFGSLVIVVKGNDTVEPLVTINVLLELASRILNLEFEQRLCKLREGNPALAVTGMIYSSWVQIILAAIRCTCSVFYMTKKLGVAKDELTWFLFHLFVLIKVLLSVFHRSLFLGCGAADKGEFMSWLAL
jgi:hypothetical protein